MVRGMSERLSEIADKLRELSMKWVLKGLDPSVVSKIEDFMDRGEGLYTASRFCAFKHAFDEYVNLSGLFQSISFDVGRARIEGLLSDEEAKTYLNVLKEAFESYGSLAIKNFRRKCGCFVRY